MVHESVIWLTILLKNKKILLRKKFIRQFDYRWRTTLKDAKKHAKLELFYTIYFTQPTILI